jgi:transcriptional regulator with XRE-family HTH domain
MNLTKIQPIGNIIRKARESKGFTQAELAERLGGSVRTVIALEKGENLPLYDTLWKLVRVLDISADSLVRPEANTGSVEMDQMMSELRACTERDQHIVIETTRTLIRKLRENGEIIG